VIALDVSGSMSGRFKDQDDSTRSSSKLDVAKESLIALLGQLRDSDRFGLLVFNDKAESLSPLATWSTVDRKALIDKIRKLEAGGGTSLATALDSASAIYKGIELPPSFSKRIFFLTDLEDSGEKFVPAVRDNAKQSLWMSIVGIGVDLSSDIVRDVSWIPGCNYSNVMSEKGFQDILNTEFSHSVTPIGYNIELSLESKDLQISSGFGTPEVNRMKPGDKAVFMTMFPTVMNSAGEFRGAVTLFKLGFTDSKQKSLSEKCVFLTTQHDDIKGIRQTNVQTITLADADASTEEYFQDTGIRKAILLVHYTDFCKEYLNARKQNLQGAYDSLIRFIDFFISEMELVGDKSLRTELLLLKTWAAKDSNTLRVREEIGWKITDQDEVEEVEETVWD